MDNEKLIRNVFAVAALQAAVTWFLSEVLSLQILAAIAVSAIPISLLIFFAFRKQTEAAPDSSEPVIDVASHLAENSALRVALEDVGLASVTKTLSNSPFTPQKCMETSQRDLSFLGVLGSKWVNDPAVRFSFESFLNKIKSKNGSVRFCLIDPTDTGYKQLHGFRDGKISPESLTHFAKLSEKHDCLTVKLYSSLPSFRVIFVDRSKCVVARYKIDGDGYFQSKYGWEAPHLLFDADAPWSLYDPFERYFESIWESAKPLTAELVRDV